MPTPIMIVSTRSAKAGVRCRLRRAALNQHRRGRWLFAGSQLRNPNRHYTLQRRWADVGVNVSVSVAANTNAKVDVIDQGTIATSASLTDLGGATTIIGSARSA